MVNKDNNKPLTKKDFLTGLSAFFTEMILPQFERIEKRFQGVEKRLDRVESRLGNMENTLDSMDR